jgi:hypothetical protein
MSRSEKCQEVMRRRWAGRREYWAEVMARHAGSGQTITAFCAQEGIHTTSFHTWRKKLSEAYKPVAMAEFMELIISPTATTDSGIRILLDGLTIQVNRGFDQDALKAVVAAFAGESSG